MNPTQLQSLQATTMQLYSVTTGLFWASLPVAFLLAMLLIYVSGEISGASFERLFKRVVIAIILLVAFPKISEMFVSLESTLVDAFGGDQSLHAIFAKASEHAKDVGKAAEGNWFKFGQWGLTLIATLSFLILAIVEHFLDVLHLTIWNLLNILGPLALLGCLFPGTSQIPKGIFMGMLELSLWRPIWVLMARILVAIGFGDAPPDPSQWFDTAVMNFAVAGLMASTPMLVKAFLGGSLASIGGGAVQMMAGGLGTLLAHLPGKAIQKIAGLGSSVGGAVTAGAWMVGGGKWAVKHATPHTKKAKSYLKSKAPSYWGLQPDNKESKK